VAELFRTPDSKRALAHAQITQVKSAFLGAKHWNPEVRKHQLQPHAWNLEEVGQRLTDYRIYLVRLVRIRPFHRPLIIASKPIVAKWTRQRNEKSLWGKKGKSSIGCHYAVTHPKRNLCLKTKKPRHQSLVLLLKIWISGNRKLGCDRGQFILDSKSNPKARHIQLQHLPAYKALLEVSVLRLFFGGRATCIGTPHVT